MSTRDLLASAWMSLDTLGAKWFRRAPTRLKPAKRRVLRVETCEDRNLLSASSGADHLAEFRASGDASSSAADCAALTQAFSTSASSLSSAVTSVSTGNPAVASSAVPNALSAAATAVTANATTQNTNFVTALYQDVLQRAPDATGLTIWINALANGTPRSSVVATFWESGEHRGIQVDGFYQRFLHRSSDAAGRQAWINNMVTGTTEESVMTSFVNSSEYKNNNPLNRSYVIGIYRDVLGRSADNQGLNTWVAILNGNLASPLQVVQSFINSHERHVNLVDSYYANFLNRKADTAGQTFWAGQLDQGLADDQSVAEAFLSSQEFFDKAA